MSEREHTSGGGLDVRTVVLAAFASAAAAVIVSQFWEGGTVISAAITPVLVTLITEGLDRPTAKIGSATLRQREQVAIPEAAGAAAPDPYDQTQVPDQGGALDPEPGVRVYGRRAPRFGKLHVKVALITGLVGFAIAAAALTIPELIGGGSLTGSGGTTLFHSDPTPKKSKTPADETTTQETETLQQTVTQPETETAPAPTQTAPAQTQAEPQPQQQQAVPPSGGQTAPAPGPTPTP